MDTAYPQHQTFAPLLGQRFDLRYADEQSLAAELIEARSLGAAWVEGGRAPFSLLFRGPVAPALPQQIFRLTHPALPELDVFLVPIEARADGVRYEAVFN